MPMLRSLCSRKPTRWWNVAPPIGRWRRRIARKIARSGWNQGSNSCEFRSTCQCYGAYVQESRRAGGMSHLRSDDGEGALLERLREVFGTKVPIVASLDLHANVTELMLKKADALVACRTSDRTMAKAHCSKDCEKCLEPRFQ